MFEIKTRDGEPLPKNILWKGSPASSIVDKIEELVVDSYNDIVSATNGRWITDSMSFDLPTEKHNRIYSGKRSKFLEALFCGQYTEHFIGGHRLTLDKTKGVIVFSFGFRVREIDIPYIHPFSHIPFHAHAHAHPLSFNTG